MHRHKFLRHAAAVLAAAALLAAVVLAGLAAALPDTLYTDGPAAELEIASMLPDRKKAAGECGRGQHDA